MSVLRIKECPEVWLAVLSEFLSLFAQRETKIPRTLPDVSLDFLISASPAGTKVILGVSVSRSVMLAMFAQHPDIPALFVRDTLYSMADWIVWPMGRHHASRTDGGARSAVGQLDYDHESTLKAM